MRWIEIRIKAFLEWIQNTLLNRPDVKVSTIIMFIQEFSNCLNDVERNKVSLQLEIISHLSLKQITIDGFIDDMKTKVLEKDLKKIKENNL